MTPVRLEPAAPRSRVKHTALPVRSFKSGESIPPRRLILQQLNFYKCLLDQSHLFLLIRVIRIILNVRSNFHELFLLCKYEND